MPELSKVEKRILRWRWAKPFAICSFCLLIVASFWVDAHSWTGNAILFLELVLWLYAVGGAIHAMRDPNGVWREDFWRDEE